MSEVADIRAEAKASLSKYFADLYDSMVVYLMEASEEQLRAGDAWEARRHVVFQAKMSEVGGPWSSMALPTDGSVELDEHMKGWEVENPKPWKDGWVAWPTGVRA